VSVGVYPTVYRAALAHDAATRQHYGPHALCNFPPIPPSTTGAMIANAPRGVLVRLPAGVVEGVSVCVCD